MKPWNLSLNRLLALVLVPLLSTACSAGLGRPVSDGCKPTSARAQPAEAAEIGPGEYRLTLVATSGSKSGSSSQGNLWLSPTSGGDTDRHPLYGATDLDFKRIGAPMDEQGPEPDPTSRDPVSPGVLVLREPKETVLAIGTQSNLRDGGILHLDGSGIGLWVTEAGPTGFSGTWRAWGTVVDGAGYFCATPRPGS